MKLSPSVGGVWGVVRMSLATMAVSLVLAVDDASAGGCPTTIRVPEDAASINAAAAMVCPGTPAEIVVGPGTWPMALATVGGVNVTIRGAGQGQTTITESAGGELLNAANGARVLLRDLTVADAANYPDLGFNIAFDNCTVRDCTGSFVMNVPIVADHWVTNSTFLRCHSESFGVLYGAPGASGCTFTDCRRPIISWGTGPGIVNCTFIGSIDRAIEVRGVCLISGCSISTTTGHGVLFSIPGTPTSALTVVGTSFTGNVNSTGNGAAIHIGGEHGDYTEPLSTTTLTNCTFTNNAAHGGGAVAAKKYQPVTMSDCTFTGNTAVDAGGGISHGGTLLATNCAFDENTAGVGGAHATGALATFVGCTFTDNHAGFGGASWSEYGEVVVTNSAFIGNTASSTYWESGGAIEIVLGTATITGSQFVGNRAINGSGGAIAANNPSYNGWFKPVRVQGCSFVNNSAAYYGGGVYFHWNNAQGATIVDCRFDGNTAPTGSAILTYDLAHEVTVSGCNIASQGFGSTIVAQQPGSVPGGLIVGTTSICAIPSVPMWGATDAGGNCFVESCADSDNNGTPDECQSVTVPGDYASVQLAIDSTPAGEFRLVSVGAGTFAGPISFGGRNVVVRGAGAGSTIIDGTGGATTSVVRFTGGEPASAALEGVTIRGGLTGTPFPWLPSALGGGGLMVSDSAASLLDCVVESNAAGFGGGAYFWQSTGSIERCIFRDNAATADGGGIQIYGGSVAVLDTVVENNDANSRGGGLHLVTGTPSLTRTIVRANFSNNNAGGVSWVPATDALAHLALVDTDVTGNIAAKENGGVAIVHNGVIATSLMGTIVCDNTPWPNISGPWENLGGNDVCVCVGDIVLDGSVNAIDMAAMLADWGTDALPSGSADLNHDGIVDGIDLASLLGSWGACSP